MSSSDATVVSGLAISIVIPDKASVSNGPNRGSPEAAGWQGTVHPTSSALRRWKTGDNVQRSEVADRFQGAPGLAQGQAFRADCLGPAGFAQGSSKIQIR